MPKKFYRIFLSGDAEIHVVFETMNGMIVQFVVKLIVSIGQDWYEVARFDGGHGCPHKDILDSEGKVVRKIWYEFLDNKQALDLGIKDLKEHHESYMEGFRKWLKK
jgi:hypothetical protein